MLFDQCDHKRPMREETLATETVIITVYLLENDNKYRLPRYLRAV